MVLQVSSSNDEVCRKTESLNSKTSNDSVMEMPQTYLYKLSPSIPFCLAKVMVPVILSLGLFVAGFWMKWFSLLGICFLGAAWYKFLYWHNTFYYFIEEVIKVRKGLFSLKTNQLELFRVKDYVITQPFLMRVFNIMTVILHTTDVNSKRVLLEGIPNSNIVDQIRILVLETRAKNRIFELN